MLHTPDATTSTSCGWFKRVDTLMWGSLLCIALTGCGGDETPAGGPIFNAPPRSDVAGLSVLAGAVDVPGAVDGTGVTARFHDPRGIAADRAGNLYVADTGNHVIRRISASGETITLAGWPGFSGSIDGPGASARFTNPGAVAVDSAGVVYVADTGNHTIRKITPLGEVSTIAGTPQVPGDANGFGLAAQFNSPRGIALDPTGNVYVADTLNHTIRVVTVGGTVETLAGTPAVPGIADGVGLVARFNSPHGIASDPEGRLYVADTFNHTIRTITGAGNVATLAGAPGASGSNDGSGITARFQFPQAITLADTGDAYVADTMNNTIRRIDQAGNVITVAGVPGRPGVVPGSLPGALSHPMGIAFVRGKTLAVTSAHSVLRLQLP